jgi:hypothetical protein
MRKKFSEPQRKSWKPVTEEELREWEDKYMKLIHGLIALA